MDKLGFKKINAENWLKPDPVIRYFTGMQNQEAYVQAMLMPRLLEKVPQDVQALFEVARGAMIYGYLFYPLYALASEQLFRVTEAAVTQKCKQLNIPRGKERYTERINWLAEQGVLDNTEAERWHTLRHLRNCASHVRSQSISPPGPAIDTLAMVAEDTCVEIFGRRA